jgi:homoserine dehydrogenase
MKKILLLSILSLLLCFTAKSQSITVENNKLCFDSAAAVELYKTIVDRESLAQEVDIYQELYTSYDSLLAAQESYKTFLRNEVSRLYTANQNLQAKQKSIVTEAKKTKWKLFWKGTAIGTTIPVLLYFVTRNP